jgi:preprotein translocase subunit YajC
MNIISLAVAAEVAPNSTSLLQNSGLMSLFPFVMIFFIFYFMLIKPQMKKQKEHQDTISSLKKGDKIVTTGGIIATIVKLEDDLLHVEIAPEVKIKITRSAVTSIYDNSSNNAKSESNKISK